MSVSVRRSLEEDGRRRRLSRRATVILLAAALLLALDLYGPASSLALLAVAIAAPVIMVVSVRKYRPANPWLWWMTVGALILFVADGVLRVHFDTLGDLGRGRTLVPDLVALPGYALLAASLFGFVLSRTKDRKLRLGIVYDGAIAALAMLACSWVFLIQPVIAHRAIVESVRAILICYPAASLCLVVVTIQIAFSSSGRPTPAERFLMATVFSMFVGDTLYMLAELHLASPPSNLLDLPYLSAYLNAGICAAHPTMRRLTESNQAPRSGWTPGRVVLIAVAFSVPALLVLQSQHDSSPERIALFGIIVGLTSMAILQILQALRSAERSEAKLRYQALHDSLTGLPNRRLLEEHLARLLRAPSLDEGVVGVLFVDLDRFKLINDTLGHTHGDELLVEVARRLERELRPTDLVTRVGGDEFVIVLDCIPSVAIARETANRIRRTLRSPVAIEGTEFFVSASIGLACVSSDGAAGDAESLIRDADTAMYQAKEAGRDAVAVFDDSMRAQLAERIEIEADLHYAIERDELHLVFQPVVRLPHGEMVGVEALVRWAHPSLGVLLPTRFIPLAEESNLIVELGAWVLDAALAQVAICRAVPGTEHLTVAVNVSAIELRDEGLVERIADALRRHGLPGSALCIELTESAVMQDPNAAVAILGALRSLDIQIAVDDFGTEYSSLAYLQRLPVDVLKIDRSFVEGLRGQDSSDESLVAAIVAMARALKIETIAEGVETAEQAHRLVRLGADAAQGYLYARPVRADRLPEVIALLSRVDQLAPSEERTPALVGRSAHPFL